METSKDLRFSCGNEQKLALMERWKSGEPLSENEKRLVWIILSDSVLCASLKHYRKRQSHTRFRRGAPREWFESLSDNHRHDVHVDRILLLARFIKESSHPVRYCFKAYQIRFGYFEEIRQLEANGIAFDSDKPLAYRTNSAFVKSSILVKRLVKELTDHLERFPTIIEVFDFWKAGENPSPRKQANFWVRLTIIWSILYDKSWNPLLSTEPE